MDTGHLREAERHAIALQHQAGELLQQLRNAVAAPPGDQHRAGVTALLQPSRELRHHAMQVAAHIGAAEAVR